VLIVSNLSTTTLVATLLAAARLPRHTAVPPQLPSIRKTTDWYKPPTSTVRENKEMSTMLKIPRELITLIIFLRDVSEEQFCEEPHSGHVPETKRLVSEVIV
jgi:hypothetical protein